MITGVTGLLAVAAHTILVRRSPDNSGRSRTLLPAPSSLRCCSSSSPVEDALDEDRVSPAIEEPLKHVEFGLDLAWDTFIAAGTILFASAMLAHPLFGRWFGLTGILVGAALYVLNFAVFPTPPADTDLVDLGPLVGAWYAAVSLQTLRRRHFEPAEAALLPDAGSRR